MGPSDTRRARVTFVGGGANLAPIVGFLVTATSDLPDHEQGLATGLTTMTQQVGITLGTPIMSAVATAHTHGAAGTRTILTGLTDAIAVDAVLCVATAVFVGAFLQPSGRLRR